MIDLTIGSGWKQRHILLSAGETASLMAALSALITRLGVNKNGLIHSHVSALNFGLIEAMAEGKAAIPDMEYRTLMLAVKHHVADGAATPALLSARDKLQAYVRPVLMAA